MNKQRWAAFWGLWFFGVGIALGGNDNPIWYTGHPMSNEMQTVLMSLDIGLGAAILCRVLVKK